MGKAAGATLTIPTTDLQGLTVVKPSCLEPPPHHGGTNRHLIQAKAYQQFPEWPLFLKEIFHCKLIWFPQQP